MSKTFWTNTKTRDKITREFHEYLGERNTVLQLSDEENGLYNDMYEKIQNIFNKSEDKSEQNYRDALYEILQTEFEVIEERQEKINNYIRRRFVVNNDLVIEMILILLNKINFYIIQNIQILRFIK